MTKWKFNYRVNHQCCPGGNRPETLRGGSPDILPKSLANPEEKKKIFFENFVWTRRGGVSGGDFRRDNIAGSHGTSHFENTYQ